MQYIRAVTTLTILLSMGLRKKKSPSLNLVSTSSKTVITNGFLKLCQK